MTSIQRTLFRFSTSLILVAGLALLWQQDCLAQANVATQATFRVKLDPRLKAAPVSGRLYVFFSKKALPMKGPNWFSPEPFFGKDVVDIKPGDEIVIANDVVGFPGTMDDLPAGRWNVQALLDHDQQFADHKNGPGNFYSDSVVIQFNNGVDNGEIPLTLNQVIRPKRIQDTQRFKLVQQKSELLSEFHGRDVIDRAGIVLPASYSANPQKRYPVYYEVTGFGGTLRDIKAQHGTNPRPPVQGEAEFIHVFLTGQTKWGHHVYADSATNGPRGEALIKEMIPLIDSKFRTIAKPSARFVGGHSSGGWSSLWLQVNYPESFGGCWSTAPDPVDFRDWQGTNIYKGESVFFEDDGKTKKPLARVNGRTLLWYQNFCAMDDALGSGGQLRSFEAVFSPLGEDGQPKQAWDRKTGVPNKDVIDYWKRYDISLLLQQGGDELKQKLAGKIHVYMGDLDTFYLEEATRLLGQRVKELGYDATVQMFPGKDHMNLLSQSLRHRIMVEMTNSFQRSQSN